MRWVVFNQKGGVGKSTLVSNLAAVAADEGERSLVVDLDPQGCSSHYLLGPRAKAARPNLADFFEQSLSIRLFDESLRTFIHASPFEGLDVLPTQPIMETFHAKLEGRHKIYKLRDALAPLTGYEHVFFDTPPALNFFTLSALIAAERVLIPFDCDDFSRRALYGLLEVVEEVRQDHNPGAESRRDRRQQLPAEGAPSAAARRRAAGRGAAGPDAVHLGVGEGARVAPGVGPARPLRPVAQAHGRAAAAFGDAPEEGAGAGEGGRGTSRGAVTATRPSGEAGSLAPSSLGGVLAAFALALQGGRGRQWRLRARLPRVSRRFSSWGTPASPPPTSRCSGRSQGRPRRTRSGRSSSSWATTSTRTVSRTSETGGERKASGASPPRPTRRSPRERASSSFRGITTGTE